MSQTLDLPEVAVTSPTPIPDVVRIENLVVRYGTFTAVNGLNLNVRQSEIFGFLGPNGAGKTTTIRVLIGSRSPTMGIVEVGGHRLPQQLAKVKPLFGYVPDTENHIEEFTGRENLNVFADLYQVPRSNVDWALQRLELDEAADNMVQDYSKGMRRKLLIAREILHEPRILYLDEPTANLDAHSTQLVRDILRQLSADGVTIFLTTHDMDEVEEICDRVAILAKGKLIACDTPANFIAQNSEQRVAAHFDREGHLVREMIDMEDAAGRARLADIVQNEHGVRVHSQEFDFGKVFLKLTGQAYT